jgi:transaldolase
MQRLLWASTGVKDKAYNDTRYVVELAAPDTVNTMPAATLDAVADHGRPHGNVIAGKYDAARQVFRDLARIGVDFEDVVTGLEQQGLASFAQSWEELIASVSRQLEKAGAEVMPGGAVKPIGAGDQTNRSGPAAGRSTSQFGIIAPCGATSVVCRTSRVQAHSTDSTRIARSE